MNESDRKAVDKLKARVSDLITPNFNDFDLLRWLQGHDYNYDFIVPNLRHHFRFMRAYDFSRIKPHPVVDRYWPSGMLGLSGKDDNFIYIDAMGSLDGTGVLRSTSMYDFILNRFCHIENEIMAKVRNHEHKTGRQSGVIMIQDLDKAAMTPTNMAMLTGPYRLYINILVTHYADTLYKCIMINAPCCMQILWRIVKPMLPEKTRKKIVILGSDWKTEILKYVDADALPVHWGGTLVDEHNDPKCQSKIVIPTKVPKEMYWFPNENEPSADQLNQLVVPAGQIHVITVEVANIGDTLWWYFFAHIEFGFGVFYTENDQETDVDKMEMVYPQLLQIYAPNAHPETDAIKCKKIGFYKFWFSNHSSWLTKLRINYKVGVEPSDSKNPR